MRIIIIIYFFTLNLLSQEHVYKIESDDRIYTLSEYTEFTSTPLQMTFDEVRQKEFSGLVKGKSNFGYNNKEKYWLRFKIDNLSNERKWVVQFDYPLLDFVELYIEKEESTFYKKSGDMLNFNMRYIQTRLINLELDLEPGKINTVYLAIQSESALDTGFKILSQKKVTEYSTNDSLFMGFYFGGLLLIAFYNLFVYLFLLDISYLIYFFYVSTYFIFQSSLSGVLFQVVLYDYPLLANKVVASSGFFTSLFITLFTYKFLKLHSNKYMKYHIYVAAILQFLFTGLSFFIPYIVASKALTYNVLLNFFPLLIYGIISWKKKTEGAKYFVFGWFFFLSGGIIFALKNVAIIPSNTFTINAVQIGSLLEVLFLSLGLANKIEILRRETDHLNKNLKQEVDIRTNQYKEEKEKVESTLLELQLTQSQLIEAERMAALGQLVGGVAHEINNPIGVIKFNVESIQENTKSILTDLPEFIKGLSSHEKELFFQIVDNSLKPKESLSTKEEREKKKLISKELQFKSFENQEDFQYCLDLLMALQIKPPFESYFETFGTKRIILALSMAKLVSGQNKSITNIGIAVEKTSRVIFALRAYLNIELFHEKVRVNLINEIEKSLSLYDNYINGKIEIERNYTKEININCTNESLIQVWRNLIFNSIQSMFTTDKKLTILVSVEKGIPIELASLSSSSDFKDKPEFKGENIIVSFRDTGIGIPKLSHEKIFSPFFTTKPVGEGIGLGLYVCKKIIHEHGGVILFQSNETGTEFIIVLPNV